MTGAEPNLLAYATRPETVRRSRFRSAMLANVVISYPIGIFFGVLLFAFGELPGGKALLVAAASLFAVPSGLLVLGMVNTIWHPGQLGNAYWMHLSIYAAGFAGAYVWFRRPRPVPAEAATEPSAAASV